MAETGQPAGLVLNQIKKLVFPAGKDLEQMRGMREFTKMFLPLLFVSGLLSACGTRDLRSDGAEALLVYHTAKNIRYSNVKGTQQVLYSVSEKYPAMLIIKWLSNELSQRGWKPIDHDFLNPRIKSSHTTGWAKFGDVTTPVEYNVYQWLADWEHPSGSVVRYELQYRYPKGSQPELTTLEVAGVYIPAELAKEERGPD